ncbi:MAG: tRNA (guanine(46)-N(7))-methyltransferase TrmB [Rhodomicrobium sp.]
MTCEEENLPPGERRDSPLRSFGRRRGRKLSPRQASLLTRGLARLRLDLSQPLGDGGLSSLFADSVDEIWLEIGFGAGEHLIWQAEHNPRAGIIGAEPYVNGVVAALSAIEARQLQGRVLLHAGDVHPLLAWLPPASLSRAFMLFPDPWPKKRHRARRLFSPALLDKMARILHPGTQFRFASDIADYAEAAIEHALHHPDFELALTFTSANRDAMPDWPITRYETKAAKAGRSSTFVVLKRTPLA